MQKTVNILRTEYEVEHGKEDKENVKRMKEDLKRFPSVGEIQSMFEKTNGKENSEK